MGIQSSHPWIPIARSAAHMRGGAGMTVSEFARATPARAYHAAGAQRVIAERFDDAAIGDRAVGAIVQHALQLFLQQLQSGDFRFHRVQLR
jgi:hypothetical protein